MSQDLAIFHLWYYLKDKYIHLIDLNSTKIKFFVLYKYRIEKDHNKKISKINTTKLSIYQG